MKNPFFASFIYFVFPCLIIFGLIKAYQRYMHLDYDAALAYLVGALLLGLSIFLSVKKKKK